MAKSPKKPPATKPLPGVSTTAKTWQPLMVAAADAPAEKTTPDVVTPATIGGLLRQNREAQGFTLTEIAGRLRIRQAMLLALENDDYAALPAPTYALGFLRSYAGFLGLDVESLVARYRRDSVQPGNAEDYHLPPIERHEGRPAQGIIWLCLILLIIMTGVLVWTQQSKGELARLVPMLPERLRDFAQALPAAPPVVHAVPATEPAGRIFGETGPARLVIVAHGQSWVEVRDQQGSLLLTRVLQNADQYRVPARPGLRFSTGDAGALSVKLDDVDRGMLGNPGLALSDLDLTPEGIETWLASQPKPPPTSPQPDTKEPPHE